MYLHELFALLDLLHDGRRSIPHLPQLLHELLVGLQQVLRPVVRGHVEFAGPLPEHLLRLRSDHLLVPYSGKGYIRWLERVL